MMIETLQDPIGSIRPTFTGLVATALARLYWQERFCWSGEAAPRLVADAKQRCRFAEIDILSP
jgi:hypothetical protein